MTYTRSQLHERISDLSGSYKAALENKRLTSEKRAEQDRLSDLARQADEKADGHLLEIAAQINEAKAQYAAAVEELIAPVANSTADDDHVQENQQLSESGLRDYANPEFQRANHGFNSIFTEPADLHSQLLAKAEANMNGAYDEATR